MQQSLGAAAASSTHPAPASTPQATQGATSMPMTPSTPISNMKSEQPDPQVLMEQLQQQFKEVRSVPSYLSHNVLRHSHRHWLIPSNLIIGYPFGIPRPNPTFLCFLRHFTCIVRNGGILCSQQFDGRLFGFSQDVKKAHTHIQKNGVGNATTGYSRRTPADA
ncbi:unnamed protein product [Strongylus vulgaris]|uniref:Uncharacterized protein n=1 Tax=Strongylus vulgaris TaxID=40348 RepID=A0A3P7JQM3_STRVU|nr:unnamed protein product [Strongylus vulgaris]